MPFNCWNRPIVGARRLLFEQLEERIVLDASVDNGLSGADSLVNSQHACSSCASQSSASAPIEASMLSQQAVTDSSGNGFYGRLHTEPADFSGLLHLTAPPGQGRVIEIVSTLPGNHTAYVKFIDFGHKGQPWGQAGQYTLANFPDWTLSDTDPDMIYHELKQNEPVELNFNQPMLNGQTTVTVSLDITTGCHVTQAEMTVHNYFSDHWHDGWDISLVNGFNYPLKIDAPYNDKVNIYDGGNPLMTTHTIKATAETGNSNNIGVFGLGNDQCCASCKPYASPTDNCCTEYGNKIPSEAHPTYNNVAPTCPTNDPYIPCDNANPKPVQSGTERCKPRPYCQMDGWQDEARAGENTFTLTFGT